MIVPEFWAEGHLQGQAAGKSFTVRRFGWSDDSPIAAQAHADARTREALERIAAGESIARREPKRAYNGADGMPIREQIVARHGETVITRNSYGAQCLNTPDVLFVDIDFEVSQAGSHTLLSIVGAALIAGLVTGLVSRFWVAGLLVGLLVLAAGLLLASRERRRLRAEPADPSLEPLQHVRDFSAQHPEWHLRVYRTPAGLRLMALHRVFSADDPDVQACFEALGADRVYARMCRNQHCFRARLTAKPWRIGIEEPLRPRPGVWPVAPSRLAARDAWVERYELAAADYAACAFVERLGSSTVHPSADAVQALHDRLCRVHGDLPLA